MEYQLRSHEFSGNVPWPQYIEHHQIEAVDEREQIRSNHNGLALECRLRYPGMFEDYVMRCKTGEVQIGKPYLYCEEPTFGILNFPVKVHWKYPAQLSWVEQSLQGFRRLLTATQISSIALPLVGCHLGKLNPDDVQAMMEGIAAVRINNG